MKKLILLFIVAIAMPYSYAQDITDAVRYSSDEIKGTARFRALSGAFGALGGDLSAVSLNPAGSAIFNRPQASISLANFDVENTTTYFGNSNRTSNSSFELSQSGAAFVFNNTDISSPWRKFVIALTYDQTNNFDNAFFASGINSRSIDSYFLESAQGLRLDQISRFPGETYSEAYSAIGNIYGYQHQQAFLGFESFILEPEDINNDANTVYFSNIAPGTFNQQYSYVSTGYNGKFGFNTSVQYKDNVFLGVNLNSHWLNYNRSTFLYETNNNENSFVTEVGFENNLFTRGTGFSFQLGGIAKVNEVIRLGFTYDSPIWYNIDEETTQYIETTYDSGTLLIINPRIINVFPRYKLQTPSKITGSIALVFNQYGLLSFDYSRKDFSKTKFKPTSDPAFVVQNNLISNNLDVSNTYRVGAEFRIKQLSLRGGYRMEESPYRDKSFYGDLDGFSLGLGYNFGQLKFDVAYENTERTINQQLYNVGLTDTAQIRSDFSDLIFTLSFSL